jgi:hypothetical protein
MSHSESDHHDDDARPLFVRELIRRVHQELVESRAQRERLGLSPIFEVESMTIEVNFVASESKEAQGGLDFKLITAGAKRQYDQQQIHKMTLVLTATAQMRSLFGPAEPESSRFMPREGE